MIRWKKWQGALLIGLMIGIQGTCLAQDHPPESSGKSYHKLSPPINEPYGRFNLWLVYKDEEVLRNKHDIHFVIRIEAYFPEGGDIRQLSLQDLKLWGSDADIEFQPVRESLCPEEVESLPCKEFIYTLNIGGKVIPKRYSIQFKVRYQDHGWITVQSFVPIGTAQEGLLQVAKGFETEPKQIKIHKTTRVHVPLENNFPDYIVFVDTDRFDYRFKKGDLYKVLDKILPEPIRPGEKNGEIVLEMQADVPWNRIFSANISTDDILELKVDYYDELNRPIRDFRVSIPLTLELPDWFLYPVLLPSLILGTFMGSALRSYRDKNSPLSRNLLLSLLAGVFAYTLAFTGKVEISALNFSLQSKDALGTLLIGFASGWAGLELIDKFFGTPPPKK